MISCDKRFLLICYDHENDNENIVNAYSSHEERVEGTLKMIGENEDYYLANPRKILEELEGEADHFYANDTLNYTYQWLDAFLNILG